MKPIYLFVASLLLLICAGVSFNWTDPDRPILVEILGAIGIFAWLPLLITAIVWARFSKVSRSSEPSETSGISRSNVNTSDLISISDARSRLHVRKNTARLFTPLRLFLLGITAWLVAFGVLEFGSSEASDIELAALALSSVTGLVATFTSIVWAIFKWRFAQEKRDEA